jgi:probable non-F420 flavinoid oxidoreductase
MCSDHIAPWSERQGQSAFAWSWLGAALQSTGLSFGVVNAPGQRYHPAVIAQAIATLSAMYEGRFWVALGSGEASNEHITGTPWPRKELRNQRLRECVDIIRALLHGEEVSHDGLVTVDRARVWTLPRVQPKLIAAAVSAETAGWAADWADGLATVAQPHDALRGVIDAYRSHGGSGRLVLQVHVSWAPTEEEALAIAHDQWRTNTFGAAVSWEMDTVEGFDEAARHVRPEDMLEGVLVSSDPAVHAERLQAYLDLGFDDLYVHHVGKEQERFIEVYGEQVLPQLGGDHENH